MRFLFVRPKICPRVSMFPETGFLQIPPHDGHPCLRLYPSHYRADSGLSPVRTCARRAHHYKKKRPSSRMDTLICLFPVWLSLRFSFRFHDRYPCCAFSAIRNIPFSSPVTAISLLSTSAERPLKVPSFANADVHTVSGYVSENCPVIKDAVSSRPA